MRVKAIGAFGAGVDEVEVTAMEVLDFVKGHVILSTPVSALA